jgi:putative polyhydroxyalkanoate system protein
MSVIRLSRCHKLNQAAQEAALEQLAAHLGDILGASVARAARTIQFDGSGFSGTVTLEDERVVGEVRLGLMMRPLKGVITREIEAGLDHYLDG